MSNIKSLKDKYVRLYANELAEEGRRLVQKAYATADFNKNRTQNLHDSYGSAVFYDGKLVPNTKYIPTSRAVAGRYNTYTDEVEYGRNEIEKFFANYKTKTKGFELVTATAMFYAKILEKGGGRLRHKYRVISGLSNDMEALAAKLGGKVIDINL